MTISRPSASVRAPVSAIDRDMRHFERRQELGAEPRGLCQGMACKLAAADAGRKSEIVLDPGTGARLAARSVPVEQQGPQPFRCAMYRRRKTMATEMFENYPGAIMESTETILPARGFLVSGGTWASPHTRDSFCRWLGASVCYLRRRSGNLLI